MTGPGDGFVLGVDLGTSHTVAMLRRPDGRTRPVLFDGQPLMPSAAFLDTTGRLHVGRDAVRLGHAEPDRFEPHPKRHIDAETVLLGGTSVPVADLLAGLLGAVAREAVADTGFLPPAVLTYPAAWGVRRRVVLGQALAAANWPSTTVLVPEPVAAARYFTDVLRRPVPVGSSLAVFDFGGGTLDIAVVRNDGRDGFVVAASGGLDDLGGLDLDSALVDHLGTILAGAEPGAWGALTDPVTLAQWRARRQFWEDVRGAKEMLSRTAMAPVPVPGVEHAVHLTRDELEAAAGPLIRRGVTEAAAVIRAAGVAPGDLAGLFLVGGSSRVPLVARLLHGELGIAPTVLEQPELPVAEGAIVVACAGKAIPAPRNHTGDLPAGAAAASAVSGRGASTFGPGAAGAASGGPGSGGPGSGGPGSGGPGSGGPGSGGPGSGGPGADGPGADGPGSGGSGRPEVRFERGHAAAATPTPTADTVPAVPAPPVSDTHPAASAPPASGPPAAGPPGSGPAGGSGSGSGELEYAEPVDPWATAEAAAFGGSGPPAPPHAPPHRPVSNPPTAGYTPPQPSRWLASEQEAATRPDKPPAPQVRPPAYRRRGWWIVAAATVVVLAAGATLAVVFWPGFGALDYRPLSEAGRYAPKVPVTSSVFTDTETIGDRAYYATTDGNGTLGIVAVNTGDAKRAWDNPQVGRVKAWSLMIALPTVVIAVSDADVDTEKRQMIALSADDGHQLWTRTVGKDDSAYFVDDVMVLVDRVANRLVGVDVESQKEIWAKANPESDSGKATSVVIAATTDDLTGPAGTTGRSFNPVLDDDNRIVQFSADRSIRVLDATNGKEQGKRPDVGAPSGEALILNGRLIVLEDGTPERVVSYDLGSLGEPTILYTAPKDSGLAHLSACGAQRVCWVETPSYLTEKAQVAGISSMKSEGLWHRDVPSAETLVPVGDSLLVRASSSAGTTTLLDATDGKVTWTKNDETVVRLDAGNLLHFSKGLSTTPDDPALLGEHLGDDPVPLGSFSNIRSETCSWNTSTIACVADKDLVLFRFVG